MTAFAAALSEHPSPPEAVGEVVGDLLDRVGPAPDLAVLFVSPALAGLVGSAAHEHEQVGLDRHRHGRRGGQREVDPGQVDPRRGPGGLAHLHLLDEHGGDDVHDAPP